MLQTMSPHNDSTCATELDPPSSSTRTPPPEALGRFQSASEEPDWPAPDSSTLAMKRVSRILQQMAVPPSDDDFHVTYFDIFIAIISIIGRIVGILINLNVAYQYQVQGKHNYFVWTVTSFVVPMVVTTFVQIAIYMQDVQSNRTADRKTSSWELLCYVITVPFLFRYCQSLSYAIASKRAERSRNQDEQRRYYELLIHEYSDIALIRIFECFLEVAPQKILQIFIILSGEDKASASQLVSILYSLVSMAWCIASYHRCVRTSQVDKVNLSWWGTLMQVLWYLLVSLSRVLSIAIVASLFPFWTLVACVVHASLMAAWVLVWDRSPFCSTTVFHSLAFSLVLGMVFIFTYILPKQVPHTRNRFAVFYTVCFAENCVCVLLFLRYADARIVGEVYIVLLSVLSIVSFILGIVFMIVFYTRFHPNILMRRMIRAKEAAASASANASRHESSESVVSVRPTELVRHP